MRKMLPLLALAAAAAVATPALAQPDDRYVMPNYAAPAAGVAVGTVAGVGLYNGWFGSSAAATSLGATAASSAVAGGVAGIGTVALIDAFTQPCAGFNAVFGLNKDHCVNGVYVADAPRRVIRR